MTAPRWDGEWRRRAWDGLDRPWDLVVVGGGITGAGILRAAAAAGLSALLLEARDFAWGTSSRSTKLAHGGLRYLAQGHLRLTRDAVREREALLRDLPGLVEPVGLLLPVERGHRRRELAYRSALGVYDALAGRLPRRALPAAEAVRLVPSLHPGGLRGALRYVEGTVDDARLVLRVLREAAALGAVALNGVEVTGLTQRRGRVTGVVARDRATGQQREALATVVVNATGSWSDRLRGDVGGAPRMRPVRGSHLLFPGWRFPLATGVVVRSPRDGRPVSVVPWEGAALVGTTDRDCDDDLGVEPAVTPDEVRYLLECLEGPFRSLRLTEADVLSTWCGVRPIVATGRASSADELRAHAVWQERGLVTAAGGKLTTYRLVARDVLRVVAPLLPPRPAALPARQPAAPAREGEDGRRRLVGRYADEAAAVLAAGRVGEEESVGGTSTTWAEVRWAARSEAVTALDDLMLRRTRLGLLLPAGGAEALDRVRAICAEELGWDASRWQAELAGYSALMSRCYAVPGTSTVSPPGTASTVTGSGPSGSPSA